MIGYVLFRLGYVRILLSTGPANEQDGSGMIKERLP
jgi:hypothetical protein